MNPAVKTIYCLMKLGKRYPDDVMGVLHSIPKMGSVPIYTANDSTTCSWLLKRLKRWDANWNGTARHSNIYIDKK